MKNDYVIKHVSRTFLFVSTLTVLAATIGMMIDSVIVGNFLGQDSLAILSIVSPLFHIFITLASILATGGSVKCAEYIGKDQPEKVNNIFTITMLTTFILAILSTSIGVIFNEQIAVILGAKGELIKPTADYIFGISLGALPIMLTIVMMSLTRIDNSPKLSLYGILVMTVVDIALDILVVTILPMGMFGIALATTIGYTTSALVCFMHFRTKHSTLHLQKISKLIPALGSISFTGLPDAFSRLSSTIRTLILNHLLIVIGGIFAVTAFSVRTSAYYIAGALTLGVAHSIVPLAAIFYGEEDKIALKDSLINTLKSGLIINITGAVVLYIFAEQFTYLFGVHTPDTVKTCILAIRLFALSMPFMLVNVTMLEFYQATRNILIANIICIGDSLILIIGFSFLFSSFLNVKGVWLAFLFAEVIMVLIIPIIIRFKIGKWPKSIFDFMLLPKNFGGKVEDSLYFSIGNEIKEVTNLAEHISEFCNTHNIDKDRSNFLALAIEEMAGNVTKHAFKPGEKKFMDIRILVKNEKIVLRIRDNCPRFNPFEYLATQDPNDVYSNIGIRLTYKMATQVNYRYSIGLNNVIITI